MIDRQYNKIVIECDACGNTFDGESGEWSEVWPAAQREGWSSRKIGDVWVHSCTKCWRPK
jgi:hypothetical protein